MVSLCLTPKWKLVSMKFSLGVWFFREFVLSPMNKGLKIVFKLFMLCVSAIFFSLAWWKIKRFLKIEDFVASLSWDFFGIVLIDHFLLSYVWFHVAQWNWTWKWIGWHPLVRLLLI